MDSQNDVPLESLRGVGRPALSAFALEGYTRLYQFTALKKADLLKLHGVGPKALRIIGEALSARGLAFADE